MSATRRPGCRPRAAISKPSRTAATAAVAIVETPAGEPVLEVHAIGRADAGARRPAALARHARADLRRRAAGTRRCDRRRGALAALPRRALRALGRPAARCPGGSARSGRWAPGAGLHLPCRAGRPARALVWRARRGARGHRTVRPFSGHRAGWPWPPQRPSRRARPFSICSRAEAGADCSCFIRREQAPMIRLQAIRASNAPPLLKTVLRFGRGSDRRAYDDRHHGPDQALRRRRRPRRGQRGAASTTRSACWARTAPANRR